MYNQTMSRAPRKVPSTGREVHPRERGIASSSERGPPRPPRVAPSSSHDALTRNSLGARWAGHDTQEVFVLSPLLLLLDSILHSWAPLRREGSRRL